MIRRFGSCLAITITAIATITACSLSSSSDDDSSPNANGTSSSGNPSASGGTSGEPGSSSGGSSGASGSSGTSTTPSGPLTPLQKKKAEMLTSIWENSTTVLQYAFSDNIGDGRGYTSGRAGFCSGTGDAYLVVKCFGQKFGAGQQSQQNKMAKYEPALAALSQQSSQSGEPQGDTSSLDAIGEYTNDWKATATDAATASPFKECQDELVYDHYFKPAVETANKWGLTSALSIAILYDSTIVHGGLGAEEIVKSANEATNNPGDGKALSKDAESKWLSAFITRRLAILHDNGGQSVDRGALYEQLRRDANWDLSATIVTNAKAHVMFPGQGYEDSGYPSCTIDIAGVVTGDPACTK